MTQRLEKDFAKLCKERQDIWWNRWYHVMGRYTAVPADFIVITKDKNILIECKECNNNVFVFERLTQKRSLLEFKAKFLHHYSYVVLCFWGGKIEDSAYFVIDIDNFIDFIDKIGKKSANLKDFQANFTPVIYKDLLTYIL